MPGRCTQPLTDTTFVPVDVSVPISAYLPPPMRRTIGTFISVSTLLISVGPAVQALDGRERRLQARVAALALERVEQRGLLAADVGAGAAVHDEVERVVGAEDALADVAGGARLGHRGVEHVGLVGVLAADEDERLVGADRVGADDASPR